MADDVPMAFYLPAGLFLKADAKISIKVKLPEIKVSGVSISNWEVMEKIKILVLPELFTTLRVVHYTREVIDFEGEFDSMRVMRKVVLLLHGKAIKLSGFSDVLKVAAKQFQAPYPTKKEWEDFFEDRGMDTFEDARPGERPDTVHIKGLPVKWFTSRTSEGKPCHRVLSQAFQKFGPVRQVGIADYRSERNKFGPGSGALHFDGYIQYEKYASFTNAMASLKGMKLLRLEDGGREAVAMIRVDFDHGAFLSDRNIRKRRREEERKQREREEIRRRDEEKERDHESRREAERKLEEEARAVKRAKKMDEKRRRKQQRMLLVGHLKAIAVRRRQEAQRLLSVLLAGAAEERYDEEEKEREMMMEKFQHEENERMRQEKLKEELLLRDRLVKNVQQLEQRKMEVQRELSLRSLPSRGGHLKSAVVIPKDTSDHE